MKLARLLLRWSTTDRYNLKRRITLSCLFKKHFDFFQRNKKNYKHFTQGKDVQTGLLSYISKRIMAEHGRPKVTITQDEAIKKLMRGKNYNGWMES